MNFYAVIIERDPNKSYKEFHDEFTEDQKILKWWHYIKNTYLIGTYLSANELADIVATYLKKHNLRTTHLAIKVDLKDSQGRLPDKAWDWVIKNTYS